MAGIGCDYPPSPPPEGSGSFNYLYIVIACCLLVLSGLFSGLNLGLMSFTADDLQILIEGSDDPKEIAAAKRIQPLRKRGNLLLCTLLLGNTLVNAVIAIMLADVASGVIGTIATTGLIVIFGEIVPQAVCSRHGLRVGAASLPIVYLFVAICFPAAWPISKVLDKVLGREISADFSRHELFHLIRINTEDPERAKKTGLTMADGQLLGGALTFKDRSVGDVMTPLSATFMLSLEAVLDHHTLMEILLKGHTRIPVYEPTDPSRIMAVLFSKDLIGIGFEREMKLRQVIELFKSTFRVHRIHRTTKLNVALDKCKRDHVHLLVVTDDDPGHAGASAVGIATIEDFLEEILGDEIVDETDRVIDMRKEQEVRVSDDHGNPTSLDASHDASTHGGRKNQNINILKYDTTRLLRELGKQRTESDLASPQLQLAERSRSPLASRARASPPSQPSNGKSGQSNGKSREHRVVDAHVSPAISSRSIRVDACLKTPPSSGGLCVSGELSSGVSTADADGGSARTRPRQTECHSDVAQRA